ncbi:MAG: polyprenyl synthetase family protein [Clostridiales Family XIII bacterium]|jgi:geranylgeranyl pyrophosphate synthase|nr:polyprenyl synthetase family protein [Clostridiales Family XIII bacterium]
MLSIQEAAVRRRLDDDELYLRMQNALAEMETELLRLCAEAKSEQMRNDLKRIVAAGGKRLRSALAYLCYQMGQRRTGQLESSPCPILSLMCMLELMHTASLIHDDVVDGAEMRRGVVTINGTSGRLAAVASGDFLLAKAMEKLRYYQGTGINEALATVSAEMCLGEFQQQRSRYDLHAQNEMLYFLQIRRKTSCFLAASCYTGALAGGMHPNEADPLRRYGDRFGLAFQLMDDLLDFKGAPAFGKQPGRDIQSGIFTLPILVLKDTLPDELLHLLEQRHKTSREVRTVLDFVCGTDALQHTAERVRRYAGEAGDALSSFKDTPEKAALVKLSDALMER